MHHNESDKAIACHLGTRVRKNRTSKRSAFETSGSPPAYIIFENETIDNTIRMGDKFSKDYNPRINLDTKVAWVKYHPGFDPEIIESLIKLQYRSIIFEGTELSYVGKTRYD